MPVTTHKLEPTTTIERVPVRKLIEVPGHKWVDQEYIDVEEQELVRDKVVWVKKVIPEKYIGQVEVKKTRKVKVCRVRPEMDHAPGIWLILLWRKVPTTLIKEVREMVEVVVPTNKLVEERGWRIDQVQDRKLVEVEEHRKFRLVPEPTGEVHIADKRCGIWLLRRHALHNSRPLQIEPCLLLLFHGWSWSVRTCDDAANSAALLGSTSLAPEVLVLCPLDRRVPGFSIERPLLAQARSTRTRKTSGAFPTTANRIGPAISPTGSSTPACAVIVSHAA